MLGLGTTELIVIFLVALIVLGPKKLPQIAKAIGRGIGQFRRAMESDGEDPSSPDGYDVTSASSDEDDKSVSDGESALEEVGDELPSDEVHDEEPSD